MHGGPVLEVLARTCGSCSVSRLTPLDWTSSRHKLHTHTASTIYSFSSSVLRRRPAGDQEIVPHTQLTASSLLSAWTPARAERCSHLCCSSCFFFTVARSVSQRREALFCPPGRPTFSFFPVSKTNICDTCLTFNLLWKMFGSKFQILSSACSVWPIVKGPNLLSL